MDGSSDSDLWRKAAENCSAFETNDNLHRYLVMFTDPRYKLPLYLSEYALHDFNIKQNEFYEKVNVVKTLRMKSVKYTTTFLITFEASLPADQTIQTFVTKLSMSLPDPHHPTTKINIFFVKIKGEEFDNEEEDDLSDPGSSELYIELDSRCDEQFKKNLSDCYKKDSEEHLDGGEQSKEKSLNFRNKISEENLKEFREERFEDKSSEFHNKDSQKTLEGIDEKEKFPEFHKKDSKKNPSKFDEEDTEKGIHYRPLTTRFLVPRKYKVGSKVSKEIESFNNDLARSDGFEVGYYPHMERAGIHGTWMYKFYDIENKTLGTTSMNHLACLSQLAICVYNMKEDTYFDNVKVLKAMTSSCGGVRYNITFEASLRDMNAEIFQARLFTHIPLPYAKIEILFVRIKPNC